jgi:hypothetical protein
MLYVPSGTTFPVLDNNRDWKFKLDEAAAEVFGTLGLTNIDNKLSALKNTKIKVLTKFFLGALTPNDNLSNCRRFLQRGEQVRASVRPVNDLPQIRHFFRAIFFVVFSRQT